MVLHRELEEALQVLVQFLQQEEEGAAETAATERFLGDREVAEATEPAPGTGNTPPVSPPQGSNGGGPIGTSIHNAFGGAGGGGLIQSGSGSTAGSPGPNHGGGPGGNGGTFNITGSSVIYGAGGSGQPQVPSQPGTTNPTCGGPSPTTSGAGGGQSLSGSGRGTDGRGGGGAADNINFPTPGPNAGGSGVVIIRYKYQ